MPEPSTTPSISRRDVARISVADGLQPLRDAIAHREACVVRDLARQWPALENWSRENLTARYGHKQVPVYDASFGEPGSGYMSNVASMSLAEYLEQTLEEGRDLRLFLYNLAHHVPELLDEVEFPDVGLRFSRAFVFSFFGTRGATTPLHFDIDMGDVLHTCISGRRRIRLFAPDDAVHIYQHPFTVRSYVDLDAPDFEAHPALRSVTMTELELDAGETLYMPAGWWHEFHYLEAGMGLSMRASSPRWSDRLEGVVNLLLRSPVDRLANKISPDRWYAWKTRRAAVRALAA